MGQHSWKCFTHKKWWVKIVTTAVPMEPEPEPEPEEQHEEDTDSVEVTVYSDAAHESKNPHPVMTVAALREKWKVGEVDDKTYIWMDHEMFVDEGGNPTTDWQLLGNCVDGFGFPQE